MENWVAVCKVGALEAPGSVTPHPRGASSCRPRPQRRVGVSTNRFRLLRHDAAVHDAELSRSEAQLRATARQQEAVAHLGQQALAGAPVDELIGAAVALASRALEVEFASVLELRPESRTLEIGRASCRERSVDLGGRGVVKEKREEEQTE